MFWLIKVILGKSLQKNFNSFGGEKFLGLSELFFDQISFIGLSVVDKEKFFFSSF